MIMAEVASIYNGESYRPYHSRRLRYAAKQVGNALLVFGMAGASVGGILTAAVRPETFTGPPEPRAEAAISGEDMVRSYIREAGAGEHNVDVLGQAVAVRADGKTSEQSIINPILKRIDGQDYLAGNNSLSQETDTLVVWRLGDGVRLCQPEAGTMTKLSTQLGWNPNSDTFVAPGVGVFLNHVEEPAVALCRVPAVLPDPTSPA